MERVGRYEVLGEVARGGMGVVLRGRDPELGRDVAIKVLLDPEPDPRAQQESLALARLRHPGVVAFYEALRDDHGRDVLVMEWVDGESLQQRLRRDGPLPVPEVLAIAGQLCGAVAHAHARGILHRDLKPHNVLVARDGQVKLADFGLGKVIDQAQSLTRTGDVLGTPAYMPPEQVTGDKAAMGPRADVYGLGATLYALLTGRPPFQAPGLMDLLYAVLEAPLLPPSTHRAELSPALDAILLRCLAREPADRYASVGELGSALDALSRAGPAPAQARRGRALVAGAALVAPVALAVGVGWAVARGRADAAASEALARAEALNAARRYAETLQVLEPALRARPDWPAALSERGEARGKLGDLAAARRDVDAALRLEPDCASALANPCWLGVAEGDLDAGLAATNQALAREPRNADALSNRAAIHLKRGELTEAVADASASLALEEAAEPYDLRGLARQQLGNLIGAEEDFAAAIRLAPELPTPYNNRAVLRAGQGDVAGALDDLATSLRLAPSADAYANRAVLLLRVRGDLDAALEAALQATRLEPANAEAQLALGATRRARQELDLAEEALSAALRLDPELCDALHVRGLVRVARDDLAAACQDLERAAALRPEDREIRANLAEARELREGAARR